MIDQWQPEWRPRGWVVCCENERGKSVCYVLAGETDPLTFDRLEAASVWARFLNEAIAYREHRG